jgi:hypothetical protein
MVVAERMRAAEGSAEGAAERAERHTVVLLHPLLDRTRLCLGQLPLLDELVQTIGLGLVDRRLELRRRDPEMAGDVVAELDDTVGLDNVYVIHANDTQVPPGGKADRHWHIGEGMLGEDTFALLLQHPVTGRLPFILETPGDEHTEGKRNLEVLKSLR